MLSLIQYITSHKASLFVVIIIGLGLGFMAMSLTSSVKYLPINKAGIGSGIVNASRYIGRSQFMALLVTIYSNVNIGFKTQIKAAYNPKRGFISRRKKKLLRRKFQKLDTTKKNNSISTKQNNMVENIKMLLKKQIIFQNLKGNNYKRFVVQISY